MAILSGTIQVRRGEARDWTYYNYTLSAGELGWESDTNKLKMGDGSTAWSSLSYFPTETVDLTATTLSSTTITVTTLKGTTVSATNISATNLSATNSYVTIVSATNISATNFSGNFDGGNPYNGAQLTPMDIASGCTVWLDPTSILSAWNLSVIEDPHFNTGVWLDAYSILPLSAWHDSSGNGNHFLSGTSFPTYFGRGRVEPYLINRYNPVSCYSSETRFLQLKSGTRIDFTDFTVFMVFRSRDVVGYSTSIQYMLGNDDNESGLTIGGADYNILAYDGTSYNEADAKANTHSTDFDAGLNIVCWQNAKFWKNGTKLGYTHQDACTGFGLFFIGRNNSYSVVSTDIVEVIIYNWILPEATVDIMNARLNARYNIY